MNLLVSRLNLFNSYKQMKRIYAFTLLTIILCLSIPVSCQQLSLYMQSQSAQEFERIRVIDNGQVQLQFQSKIYENPTICTNGMLKLIQFNASKTQPQLILFQLYNTTLNSTYNVSFSTSPNQSPSPIISTTPTTFQLSAQCQPQSLLTNQNYYNHIKISLIIIHENLTTSSYDFSFLLNCDRYNRHKKFQYGYLLIGLINAAITIGVAMHSRIWSIRINQKPLRILLTWKLFLIIMIILIAVGVTFYLVASKQFKLANQIIKYLGLVVAFVFTFICMNEIFYLFRPLKKTVLLTKFYNIRRCELISLFIALVLFIVSLFVENWILYTFLAGCICVGCIKMLYFSSMQQAFYSLAISVTTVTLIAIILHFILPRSYNDYASQLSSPLFIEVPDLVDNLFKKCSWLPVVDIIVPGVLLSFLRTYDNNFSTGWGGVYTITGNLSFLLSTTLWIAIQVLYPFSVPFSLITYTFLLLAICIIAFKRNQLKTLWYGYFLQQSQIDMNLLKQDTSKKSQQQKLDQQTMNVIRIRDSISSKADDEQNYIQSQGVPVQEVLNPKMMRSEFKTRTKPIEGVDQTSKGKNVFASSLR